VRVCYFAIGFILVGIFLIAQPRISRAGDAPPPSETSTTVVDRTAVRGILGRPVQDADGKEMGRVIDVVVDPLGRVRAAIIDFGGFLGVGSRKIAVNWNALHFGGAVKHEGDIKLELTQDQLKAAPEYKDGSPVVVIGSSGGLEPLDFPSETPEK
jgi:sporulation protein YlmC with PRC-barrel domain